MDEWDTQQAQLDDADEEGAVLALAEGRMQKNDHGWVDIVLRRSFDGGETWSPTSVVHT